MTPARIDAIVTRFAVTAHRAEEAGFDGAEVHAAHDWGCRPGRAVRRELREPGDDRPFRRQAYAGARPTSWTCKDLVKTSPLPLMLTGGSRGAPPPNEYGTAASLSSAWAPPSLSLRTCPKARV
ncbi:hypothetical protein ACH4MJ_35550 [Streptomyces anulatus]